MPNAVHTPHIVPLGRFLFVALYSKPQEDFTTQRNTPGLQFRHLLDLTSTIDKLVRFLVRVN
jgi:hypothetical protein